MATAIFITGTGTDVGKTLVSAVVAEALNAHYWKPIQAGFADGTDAQWVQAMVTNIHTKIFPELYKLQLPASPHIAAREEGLEINLQEIKNQFTAIMESLAADDVLVIEGAGGIMVPLNETAFVADLIKLLQAKVILVSRNYLGSINHSLLTAGFCRQSKIDVAGWIFNDQYMSYEEEIVHWSGFPKIGTVPFGQKADKSFIAEQAALLRHNLETIV